MRFSPGTSGMPLGTAHDAATPSCSRRRSQCRRVALCSWTTNRPPAASVSPGAGSGVAPKLRFARYSASPLEVGLFLFVCFAIRRPAGLILALLGEAVERGRVLAVLGVFAQQLLGLFEAFLLSTSGFVHSLPRRVVSAFFWGLHG